MSSPGLQTYVLERMPSLGRNCPSTMTSGLLAYLAWRTKPLKGVCLTGECTTSTTFSVSPPPGTLVALIAYGLLMGGCDGVEPCCGVSVRHEPKGAPVPRLSAGRGAKEQSRTTKRDEVRRGKVDIVQLYITVLCLLWLVVWLVLMLSSFDCKCDWI